MIVRPHSSTVVPIVIPQSLLRGKDLLFIPQNVVDQSRELMGVMPAHFLWTSTPVIQFNNVCEYPIRIKKGQVMGSATVVKARTMMTHFASPTTMVHQPMSPQWPAQTHSKPSRLDTLWHTLV